MDRSDSEVAVTTTLYRIGEAADLLGVSVATLRLYEREGLILPFRKSSRHRLYSDSDLERVRCIRQTITSKQVSIAGIRRMLALIPCWKIRNCPENERNACPGFTNDNGACWTVPGKAWECRTDDCRQCSVYREISDCSALKQTIVRYTHP